MATSMYLPSLETVSGFGTVDHFHDNLSFLMPRAKLAETKGLVSGNDGPDRRRWRAGYKINNKRAWARVGRAVGPEIE